MVPKYPVVLASASPRRVELLRELITDFEVLPADLDEDSLTVKDPWETARTLALAKAKAVALLRPDALVIGSDTVVALPSFESTIQLAKPTDEEDAKKMLAALSGKSHWVITGVALVWPEGEVVEADETEVTFRDLTAQEISEYVDSGEPMDKAGAYAIQGGAASFVVTTTGSLSNVIGLPVDLLRKLLDQVPDL